MADPSKQTLSTKPLFDDAAYMGDRKTQPEPVMYDALARAAVYRRAQEPVACPANDRNAACYGKIYTPPTAYDGLACGRQPGTKSVQKPESS